MTDPVQAAREDEQPVAPTPQSADLPDLAILLVCRNRRATTLRALRSISAQQSSAQLHVVLFDDASTDGTPDAVMAEFPEVSIVHGDGNAFWNGGLHKSWKAALDKPVGAFLWLNDDVDLDSDAFARLAGAWRSAYAEVGNASFILVGATRGEDGEVSYGALRCAHTPFAFRVRLAGATETLTLVDTFNGNIVLVPRTVVDKIGINDEAFHHNMGDVDYGLRARSAGIPVLLIPGTLGFCAANDAKTSRGYGAPSLSTLEQWRKVNSHHGLPVTSWWRLTTRHSGKWWPLHFLIPYRWLFLPRRGKSG